MGRPTETTLKEKMIESVMGMVSKAYTEDSGVYQIVKKGLRKLTMSELSNLESMIMTSIYSLKEVGNASHT